VLASLGGWEGLAEPELLPEKKRPPQKAAATKAGATGAHGTRKIVAGSGESDEHERRVDGVIIAGPRIIPADG